MNPRPESFETSREAYQWCVENGVVSQRVADVLKVLAHAVAPMNQTMVHAAVMKATGNFALQKYSVSPRFSVLLRMGLIREVGDGPCPASGRRTMFYEATNLPPTCTEAEAEKAARARESVAALKAELKEARREIAQLRELLNMRSASHAELERRLKSAPVEVQTSMF